MARRKNQRGQVEESVELDGHRFKLETWGARDRAAIAIVAVVVPLFLVIQLTTDTDMPFWMFAMVGLWVGLPSAYEMVVQERGLRIRTTENALGRLTRRFTADPLRGIRATHASGDDVVIPWESIAGVQVSAVGRHKRTLDLQVDGVSICLDFAVRGSHAVGFERMAEHVRVLSARSQPASVPDEVQRLRGKAKPLAR